MRHPGVATTFRLIQDSVAISIVALFFLGGTIQNSINCYRYNDEDE
jgi:hypothetical protein